MLRTLALLTACITPPSAYDDNGAIIIPASPTSRIEAKPPPLPIDNTSGGMVDRYD
ncbi:hypothetical protein N9571_01260 [Yoonia sp.]|nr:hypothetical protein [Yoonia sp.]